MKKEYAVRCHPSVYRETEKAIGFTLVTGLTGARIGMKYFPKSQITINKGKYAAPEDVEIIIPAWLMEGINSKCRLECAEVE